ncbi:integrase arm-type DNA-binding domain-containing protein [Mesorhizobium sp. M0040]|uniref:integrase arm-type DNA-binding domain-containing protein n=1 Tax=Mesorhizobium sp. M0040 TaxID=2956855 RepID=UPI00333D9FBE
MTDLRLALTDRAVASLEPASSDQYFARDTDLPGFMVLVGKRQKTFVVQGERRKAGRRLSVRMKVAEVGELTTRAARAKPKDILGKIANGIDPRASTRKPGGDAAEVDLPSESERGHVIEHKRNAAICRNGGMTCGRLSGQSPRLQALRSWTSIF